MMNSLVGLHPSYVAILFLLSFRESYAISSHPIVVVFGFDGFRYDYLSRGLNPVLQKLSEDGVSVDFLANIFPTKTFVNFFAIATGMYAETHGVLGNKAFNENGQCLRYGDELYHYDDQVIPIWILNEMSAQGRHSGCMMWSGCDYSYQNHTSTYFQKYEPTIKWTDRIDTIMNWLLDTERPVNLVNAYFEQPDAYSHLYGPYSNQVNEKLKNVDDVLQYFLLQIHKNNLRDRINLIVLSDHGMAQIKTDEVIKITEIIDPETYTKCGDSPMIQILPKPGYEEQIYENLTAASIANRTFTVYKAHEIPDRWHWKNNKRNIGLLALANTSLTFDDNPYYRGNHGYPPEVKNMRAFFAATGPIFRKHYHTSSLRNIDVYPLIAHILHLSSPPKHVTPNGTLTNIVHILNAT